MPLFFFKDMVYVVLLFHQNSKMYAVKRHLKILKICDYFSFYFKFLDLSLVFSVIFDWYKGSANRVARE